MTSFPKFSTHFVDQLSPDPSTATEPRQVLNAHYSFVRPDQAPAPKLLHWSPQLADSFKLSPKICGHSNFLNLFSGNWLPAEAKPYATCYGGHQFGVWAGQLGDGRAINIGEVQDHNGEDWTLQLKGSGLTPYARAADGYAVLRSSLREYLCSEAMHALGVPTTRALTLCLTGRQVRRDMFYSGHPEMEQGAVVCRTSRSFLRFGHYEIFAARQDHDRLKQLMDWTIREYFPLCAMQLTKSPETAYIEWFKAVRDASIDLVVHWLRVGFVHGVLNSDNTSILGETIDYGPYGWLEDFDPSWTPNTTDTGKRYCFAMQPKIIFQNLWYLANAIHSVVKDNHALELLLSKCETMFTQKKLVMMRHKLGLTERRNGDAELIGDFEDMMHKSMLDMTNFFRFLTDMELDKPVDQALLWSSSYLPSSSRSPELVRQFTALLEHYRQRRSSERVDPEAQLTLMNRSNPIYVPRNYLLQTAIDAIGQQDVSVLETLFEVLTRPYEKQPNRQSYRALRPDWALDKPGCSMLSCSS